MNRLRPKLNEDKTELIIIKNCVKKLPQITINIKDHMVASSKKEKKCLESLQILLELVLSHQGSRQYLDLFKRECNKHPCKISDFSKLDYNVSLLASLTKALVDGLQTVQNTAARETEIKEARPY